MEMDKLAWKFHHNYAFTEEDLKDIGGCGAFFRQFIEASEYEHCPDLGIWKRKGFNERGFKEAKP